MDRELSPMELALPAGKTAPGEPFPPVLAAAVRSALDRVLRSPDFRASKRNRKFLQRIVETELAGRGHEINGFLIGSEVFGRGKSFDHVKDPIVRIEATKLRRDLERYYLTAGRADRIVIAIPKGCYRPTFATRENTDLPDGPASVRLDPAGVTIASLRSGETGAASDRLPLRAQLADGLARFDGLAVFVAAEPDVALLDSDAVRRVARSNGTGFVLSGDVWSRDGHHRLVLRLHEGRAGRLVWTEEFPHDGAAITAGQMQRVAEARRHAASSRSPEVPE